MAHRFVFTLSLLNDVPEGADGALGQLVDRVIVGTVFAFPHTQLDALLSLAGAPIRPLGVQCVGVDEESTIQQHRVH